MKPLRAGFIINSRVPSPASIRKGMPPHALFFGWDDSASPMSFMRFRWIARDLLRRRAATYELYKPWRRYDAVVFLKSMGGHCIELAQKVRSKGAAVVFEANVDYYTLPQGGAALFPEMVPTDRQRKDATRMASFADGVIASSRHLASTCAAFNRRTAWVPDNVDMRMAPRLPAPDRMGDGRLHVWWSGMASKLCEFLSAEEAFLRHRDRLHLHFVTGARDAGKQWPGGIRERFESLLARVPHTFHPFQNIPGLLRLYAGGGVIVSPRFLDMPYNLSHTEWKITLGMACGLPAIASPVPSYLDVAERAGADAVRICSDPGQWSSAFNDFFSNENRRRAGEAASGAVCAFYSTPVVATRHLEALAAICERRH